VEPFGVNFKNKYLIGDKVKMDEKKSQPAWKKDVSKDHKNWNRQKKDRRQEYDKNSPVIGPLEVEVYNNDLNQALKVLKNKISKDGILTELKGKSHRNFKKQQEGRENQDSNQ
jgi:ribosomal protein S21